MIFTVVLLLSGGLVAYAATMLFTQTFPSQTFATGTLQAGTNCTGGSLVLVPTGSSYTIAGSPAILEYACNSSGSPAFTSTGSTSDHVNATPSFAIPSGWNLYVPLPIPGPVSCLNFTFTYTLTSGTQLSIIGGTSYFYCLTTTSASNFTSFTITWSQ
jgi:hypothetical protein